MNWLQKWLNGNWSTPIVSGALIIASFALQWIGGGGANVTLGPQWWLDAGSHSVHATGAFTLADALMLAGAVVAGYAIVVKALRALVAKIVGIDRKSVV